MTIKTNDELERALHEFHALSAAKPDSPEGRRRGDLDAEIRAYDARRGGSLHGDAEGGSGMPGRY